MNSPLISCKMITYGRVEMLEESLHSFLQQTYSPKELIIVNDYPLQTLVFDHPEGKIPTGDVILKPHWNHDYYGQLPK